MMRAAFALVVALLAQGAYAAGDPAGADQSAAELAARRRLSIRPDDDEARYALARALNFQQRHEAARAEFGRLLKRHPKNADYLLGAAQAELWRGQPALALPLLRRARGLAPTYEDVWRVQIQALLALGDADRIRQAGLIRAMARERFPQGDWRFAALDGKPPVALTSAQPAMALQPSALATKDAQMAKLGSESTAPVSPAPKLPAASVAPQQQSPQPAPVSARDAAAKPVTGDQFAWELSYGQEHLTRGLPDWRSLSLTGEWRRPDGQLVYGGWRETERYDLRDGELHLGAVINLATAHRLQVEAGVSDTHRVLARDYVSLQWQHEPAPGWALAAGWRGSRFDTGRSRVWSVGADRYFGSERIGYTRYDGGPEGAGLTPSHRLQWAHYYGERDWVGLTWVSGRETEYISSGVFRTAQIRGAALAGRHHLGGDWSLGWEYGYQRQGDFYTRNGFRLALRRAF